MDPRASVKEALAQGVDTNRRRLSIPPPPPPSATDAPPQPDQEEGDSSVAEPVSSEPEDPHGRPAPDSDHPPSEPYDPAPAAQTEIGTEAQVLDRPHPGLGGTGRPGTTPETNGAGGASPDAPPRGRTRKEGTEEEARTPGVPRGRQRQLHANLPTRQRGLLEEARHRTGEARGVLIMEALRARLSDIEASHPDDPPGDVADPFGSPYRARQRRGLDDPRLVPFYVGEHEAAGIGKVCQNLDLSVSELLTEAIERHYAPHGPR